MPAPTFPPAALFPPDGIRSGGGVRPLGDGFARYHGANSSPLIGLMIETVEGVANAAQIASVPGVDFVFLGTGDLALSIGCFPAIDHRHEEACQAVRAACEAVAVPCGIFTTTIEAAQRRLAEGYAAVVAANDIDVIASGFSRAGAAIPRR